MIAAFAFTIVILVASIQALSHLSGGLSCSIQELHEMADKYREDVAANCSAHAEDITEIGKCTEDKNTFIACIEAHKHSAEVVVELIHTISEDGVQLLRDFLHCIFRDQREANYDQERFVLTKSVPDGLTLSHITEVSDCSMQQLEELWERYQEHIYEAWDTNKSYFKEIMSCIHDDEHVIQCIKAKKDAAEKVVDMAQTFVDLYNQMLEDSLKCITG